MRKEDTQGLPIYESHPPEWLPKAHGSADLGMNEQLQLLSYGFQQTLQVTQGFTLHGLDKTKMS